MFLYLSIFSQGVCIQRRGWANPPLRALRYTVKKRAVRILLECIFVLIHSSFLKERLSKGLITPSVDAYNSPHWFIPVSFTIHQALASSVADLRGREGCAPPPPGGPNSFNFMQFLGKYGKVVCWCPPGSWCPLLGEILDPPLIILIYHVEKKSEKLDKLGKLEFWNFTISSSFPMQGRYVRRCIFRSGDQC